MKMSEPLDSQEDKTQEDINVQDMDAKLASFKNEQNFIGGIGAALAAALVGAGIWTAITVTTEYQIGYMAVAVGYTGWGGKSHCG